MIPKFMKRPRPRKLGLHPAVKALLQAPLPPMSAIPSQPPIMDQPSNIPTLGIGEYQCVRAMERQQAPDPAEGAEPAEVIAAIEAHGAAPKPQE
jgi:hypothetical protein